MLIHVSMNCVRIYKMFIFIVRHITHFYILIIVIITVIKISDIPFFVNYFFYFSVKIRVTKKRHIYESLHKHDALFLF